MAIDPASTAPATHFTLNLKPNINDYSCTSCALLWWNSEAPAENGWAISLLEHPPGFIVAQLPKE
jgi:hypothetical protein